MRGVCLLTMLFGLVFPAACGAKGRPVGTYDGCPTGLRAPVAATTWQPAVRYAARVFLETTYARWSRERHWGMRLAGAQVGRPFLVRHWLPSGWIETECGAAVWKRSVGVPVAFPAMEYPNPKGPCNACAHVTLLFGLTRRGWTAWGSY